MSFRLWILATIAIAAAVGIALFIVQRYITPPPPPATLEVVPVENSCGIKCPPTTPHAGSSGSVICTAGLAPLCQCTDSQRPKASCVSTN